MAGSASTACDFWPQGCKFFVLVFKEVWLSDSQKPEFNKFLFFLNVYFWDRDREPLHEGERGRERGRHKIWGRLQAVSCHHEAWRRAWTYEPRDRDLSQNWTLNQLSPLAPLCLFVLERERQTECEWGRSRESGRHKIWSRLQSLMRGSNP